MFSGCWSLGVLTTVPLSVFSPAGTAPSSTYSGSTSASRPIGSTTRCSARAGVGACSVRSADGLVETVMR